MEGIVISEDLVPSALDNNLRVALTYKHIKNSVCGTYHYVKIDDTVKCILYRSDFKDFLSRYGRIIPFSNLNCLLEDSTTNGKDFYSIVEIKAFCRSWLPYEKPDISQKDLEHIIQKLVPVKLSESDSSMSKLYKIQRIMSEDKTNK